MRIGVMLRAYDKPGGIGIYSRNIVKHLLELDSENSYTLFYNNPDHVGGYGDRSNVEEIFVPQIHQLVWDQWHIRQAMKRSEIDLVFNTKFSVPLGLPAKRVMVLHGASWFVHPELYKRFDIMYVKTAMPLYCRACDHLISNSELTTRDFIRLLKVPEDKITTIRLAAGENFKPVEDSSLLSEVRARYDLPERYVLTVTSYDPRKNFSTLLKAFKLCREKEDVHMVVIGKNCHKYIEDYGIEGDLKNAIHFPGWVEQDDLPAIYSMARVFAFPSVYEEFGIPVVEAMSCGCPIVASNTGAIPDLCEDAALLSDPMEPYAFGENVLRVLQSEETRDRLTRRGLEKAKSFSWVKAAEQTLDVFSRIANG